MGDLPKDETLNFKINFNNNPPWFNVASGTSIILKETDSSYYITAFDEPGSDTLLLVRDSGA
jgi:hypothetical protein